MDIIDRCKYLLFTIILLSAKVASYAQSSRIGFIDYQLIYSKLPDVALAEQKINNHYRDHQTQMQQRKKELDRKYQAIYTDNSMVTPKSNSQSDLERTAITRESAAIHEALDKGQLQARQMNETLYKPINEKIQKAMQEVATEKGYSCIIEVSTVVYYVESDDITLWVLKKLNVNKY